MHRYREEESLVDYHDDFQAFEDIESNRMAQAQLSQRSRSSFEQAQDSFRKRIRYFITNERQRAFNEKHAENWNKHRVQYKIIMFLLSIVSISTMLMMFFGTGSFLSKSPRPVANPRKAVVLASTLTQNVTWLNELPRDWEVYRYFVDDKTAKYHTPVNSGREAMVYTTFMIDHYHDLPDYVVFIHGHERAWHQPEPMQWRLPTLNLEALEKDQYISLHCLSETSCSPAPRLNFKSDWDKLDKTARLIPWFWKYAEISDTVPDALSWPDSAQFAVTKAAIRRRSLEWWTRYRKPMLVDDERMDHFDYKGYYWGLLHERLWHVAFQMNPIHCPDQNYCTKVQWNNGVLCDIYPALPIKQPWIKHNDVPGYVTCWKNDDKTLDWPMKRWSLCNETIYMLTKPTDCPFANWPIP